MSLLFTLPISLVADLQAIELTPQYEELLQKFFDDNPDYFIKVSGEIATPNEAYETIHDGPPPNSVANIQRQLDPLAFDSTIKKLTN